ncbi:uncharacterized protein N7487_004515 [Penicillium crustosum]|uniref:uncharacterized protein n=1 Tax=Penicillium crustosum TaxID=36656 RepID=UPI00238BECF2|nr:uncharacterized protein N7487_004515 [Penicillium crustosum]KAJ5410156.1 hypothetical protein N7487_004515 [Penicillium crustosum]
MCLQWMSCPYLCPSAWISAAMALQQAKLGSIIFGNEKYFYLLTHGVGDNEDQDQRTSLVF